MSDDPPPPDLLLLEPPQPNGHTRTARLKYWHQMGDDREPNTGLFLIGHAGDAMSFVISHADAFRLAAKIMNGIDVAPLFAADAEMRKLKEFLKL